MIPMTCGHMKQARKHEYFKFKAHGEIEQQCGVADRLKMLVVDISDKKKCKTKNRAHRLAAVQL